jgi:hypothetical protein
MGMTGLEKHDDDCGISLGRNSWDVTAAGENNDRMSNVITQIRKIPYAKHIVHYCVTAIHLTGTPFSAIS